MHRNEEKALRGMAGFAAAHGIGFLPYGRDGRMICPLTMATRDVRTLRKRMRAGNGFGMHARDLAALSVNPEVLADWTAWMEGRGYPVSPCSYEADGRVWMLYKGMEPDIANLFGFDVDLVGGGVAVVPWSEAVLALADNRIIPFPRKLSAEITETYDIDA